MLKKLHKEQVQLLKNEEELRKDTNVIQERVIGFGFVSICALVVVSAGQYLYLRSYFRFKKIS